MFSSHTLYDPIKKALLHSLLPFIIQNEEWIKYCTLMAKTQNIQFIVEGQNVIQKQKCPLCTFAYEKNLLILAVHLHTSHEQKQNDDFKVTKYQITNQGIQVYICKKQVIIATPFVLHLSSDQKSTYFSHSFSTRCLSLLSQIFVKFHSQLTVDPVVHKLYHSYNIFRPIQSIQSENQNSQDQQCLVQSALQKLRINDFNDVSQNDKKLYLEWNLFYRNHIKGIIPHQNIFNKMLMNFAIVCVKKAIPRLNFFMHLYTLWSNGKINQQDVFQVLTHFDKLKINNI